MAKTQAVWLDMIAEVELVVMTKEMLEIARFIGTAIEGYGRLLRVESDLKQFLNLIDRMVDHANVMLMKIADLHNEVVEAK